MSSGAVTWFVVADGGHARVMAHSPIGYTPISAMDSISASRDSHDLGGERPGRSVESVGSTRHAIEPRVDRHQQAKLDFATAIAEVINDPVSGAAFAELVLVAPAKIATAIKSGLNAHSRAKLVAEYHKDLCKLGEADLRERLSQIPRALPA